jgi:WD40 repeat protein
MLWNCRTGELEKTLPGPPDAGHAATLTPNAAFAAWSCKDGTIRVWGLTEEGRRVALKADGFLDLATSADGKRIAAAGRVIRTGKSTFYIPTGQAEDAMVWNVDRTSHEVTLKGHARGITALAFSPDAEVFATGGADGIVKLWHLPTGLPLLADIKAHRHGVDRVAFSPKGRMLATGGAFDPDVKIWDVGSGALLTTLSWTDDPKPDSMLIPIAFSPDGGSLAVAAEEGIVAVWRVPTPDPSSVQE